MARLPYIAPDHEVADRIRQRRDGTLTPLDAMLLHSPEFAVGWYKLLGTVLEQCTIPPDVREAVILRIAVLNDADYEWAAHEPPARAAGLSAGDLEAIRSGAMLPSPVGTALRYADVMTREVAVPDAVFAEVRRIFDDRQVLELTITIAAYNMVSRLLVALQVWPGDEMPSSIAPLTDGPIIAYTDPGHVPLKKPAGEEYALSLARFGEISPRRAPSEITEAREECCG